MIQIYADGALTYDSRLEGYDLQGLRITAGLSKGGTAEIAMPPNHPAANRYVGYRTVVEIYRDGVLRFRGRALYPIDDVNNARTVVCEGELCFLQDGISRPYLYQDTPQAIFEAVVMDYNGQVEAFKQFKIGNVTVTDPNDYVRLESEEAETVLATINKLTERCGGYIVFTTDETGARVIHWLTEVGNTSSQVIEDGENLFDFSRSGANTDMATALVPYGAKDETTGERLTISSVNDGKDYIVDETAAAIRGTIFKTAVWDDVTLPENLLRKARQYLNECKLFITSLTLTALDLSYVDRSVESFKVGDRIRVISPTHGIAEDFQLVDLSEDLLNPASSYITLGKEIRSLTGLDVAGDQKGQSELEKTIVAIKQDFEVNAQRIVDQAMQGTEERLTSLIEQQADSIKLEVSGSLGGTAEIKLTTAGGAVRTSELDLSAVRQAFANDTSAVEVSGGTITFNSNTLIVNSTNLQVSEDGTITATNAVLSGTATTENGDYKSELSAGRLRFSYAGTEMGGIASGYMSGDTSVRGVAVRLEKSAKYIGFSKASETGDGYDMVYCISFGANVRSRTERHLFFGTAYFDERVVLNGGAGVYGNTTVYNSLTVNGALVMDGTNSIKFTSSTDEQITAMNFSTDDKLSVGNDGYDLFLYGSNVCVGHSTDGAVYIRGATSSVNSPCTFNNSAYFASNAYFQANTFINNNTGVKGYNASGVGTIWALAVNSNNEVVLGDADFTTYVQGATIAIGNGSSTITVRSNLGVSGALQLNNGYGVQIKNTSGAYQYVLSFNNQNQVNVGASSYPMYLRGTSVTVNTGSLMLAQGSLGLANGYGVQGKDTSGNSVYILSMNSSNQVSVGNASYPTYLRGSGVYLSSTGATVTSDRRKKNSIEAVPDAYEDMLDRITPVRYRYNDGKSGRYHVGFIAQDVQEALAAAGLRTQDFGGFVDVNGDGAELGLIYAEFIALLLHKIKRQEKRIKALEEAKA
ncbi:MAG: phage tail protein [Rikenellaceae bacterium]|nr:phage tail protein [Rikenellaceae bacterium]